PAVQGRKWRMRSPESVVDELAWLTNRLEVNAILFRDPEFALQRDRVVGICEDIIKRGLRIGWRCETRMEDLDEDLVELMAKAGCLGINMGVESADAKVLQNVKRRAISFEKTERVIKSCKKNSIETFCFFILGLPGETKQSALKTIDYALRLNSNFAQFAVATAYPGTKLRKWAAEKGYIKNEMLNLITGYDAAMCNEHMSVEEIKWLQQYANEALSMQWHKVAGRLWRNFRDIAAEIKRVIVFQGTRSWRH
ncbi:MAG: B12-binding domain-containing radical SAM protein, partial [bacterium]